MWNLEYRINSSLFAHINQKEKDERVYNIITPFVLFFAFTWLKSDMYVSTFKICLQVMKHTCYYVRHFCLLNQRNKAYTYSSSNNAKKRTFCTIWLTFYSIMCDLTTWWAMKILLLLKAKINSMASDKNNNSSRAFWQRNSFISYENL
jgi:hypothetical protein